MNEQEVLQAFSQILGDLLFDSSIELTMESTRSAIPAWDSFAYVNFIVAVELEYSIKFSIAEIESFENVGAIVDRTVQTVGG